MYAIIAALVRCSRYQPIMTSHVVQIDGAMSVYGRNKKARKERALNLDRARTKKPAQWRANSIRYRYVCTFD